MASTLRRVASMALVGTALAALAGCIPGVPNRLDFSDTEKAKITDVDISSGSGDVTVRTSAIAETRIKRVVRYRGTEPGTTYRLDGTTLHLDTDCGLHCSVSYDIEAPIGVAVHGKLTSGNMNLTGVSAVDVTVSSGDVQVSRVAGTVRVEATSGNITLTDLTGQARLVATSGDIKGRGLGGAPLSVKVSSGNIDLELARPGPVTADAGSGDVTVSVPEGTYRVRTDVGSGDKNVTVPDDPTATNLLDVSTGSGNVTLTRG